jgi:beta-phosphoglucomutase-like phosphatase (HAD superfamily)
MAKAKETGVDKREPAQPPEWAVLFELENIASDGRRLLFERLKKALADKETKLSPASFSRFMVDARIKDGVAGLIRAMGRKRVSEEKFTEVLMAEIENDLLTRGASLPAPLSKLLAGARDRGIPLGAWSGLSGHGAAQLAEKLGLTALGVRVVSRDGDNREIPTPDGWLRVASAVGMSPRRCLVLTTSAGSCRAALDAAMRCAVIADAFTSFQDFGGADFVTDAFNAETVSGLLALVGPRQGIRS